MDRWKKVRQNSLTEEPPASAWDVVDVDKRDEKGRTALLNVSREGDDKMVRLLIIHALHRTCALRMAKVRSILHAALVRSNARGSY